MAKKYIHLKSYLKNDNFLHKHKKEIQKHFMFHFENIYPSIGFIVNWV
jgi:hypothetical protein